MKRCPKERWFSGVKVAISVPQNIFLHKGRFTQLLQMAWETGQRLSSLQLGLRSYGWGEGAWF